MIVRWLIGLALAALLMSPPTSAMAANCDTDVYFSVDYARPLLLYSAESLDRTCLAALPTAEAASANLPLRANPQDPWSTYGQVARAALSSASDGSWTAAFDLSLQPGQRVRLLLPFVAIDFAHVNPPPANLQALLATSTFALDGRIANDALEYDGAPDTPSTIHIIMPFTPVHKAVSLTLTPLFGRMLLGQTDSFRVSGTVGIDVGRSAHELVRHCQSPPGYSTDSYRSADLLFTLDNPPRSGFAMEPRLFLAKPSYLAIATDVVSCEANAGTGTVQAAFNGRVQHRPDLAALFPAGWLPATSLECNRAIGPQATTAPPPSSRQVGCPTDAGAWPRSAYELTLGEIALGPTDTLDIHIPGVDVLGVKPIPDHADLGPTASPMLSYRGPSRFALTIEYRPLAALVAEQIPSTLRALAQPLDAALSEVLMVDPAGCALPVAFQTLMVVALAAIATWGLRRFNGPFAWIAAGCLIAVLYFGVRGVFGLLAASLLLWASRTRGSTPVHWATAGVGLVLIGIGLRLDCAGMAASPTLQANGPLTPIVLLPLGVLLVFALSRSPNIEPSPSVFAIALLLTSVAAFDVLEKSLVVLLILGPGLAWIAIGVARSPQDLSLAATADRIKACTRRAMVPVGLALLAIFTFENSLTNTVAYAEAFTQWTAWFQDLVLLASILLTFVALGALFLVLYPLLPSRIGYIKALAFGAYFLMLFLVGVGADERLIVTLPQLTIGRAVYYLAVPVLIGVFLDLSYRPVAISAPTSGEPAPSTPTTPSGAASAYLDRLRSRISTVGAIVSILAPSIYASVARSPVVTSYFDLLNQLAKSA